MKSLIHFIFFAAYLLTSVTAMAQVQFTPASPAIHPKPKPATTVILVDDQALLPPYLADFAGGPILNLKNRKGNSFSAQAGQFLDHGSRMELPEQMATRVWMHANLQWVAGGRFRAQVSRDVWVHQGPAQFLAVEYGWLSVWIKSAHRDQEMGLTTPHVKLFVKNARLILQVKSWVTELYVLEGDLVTGAGDVVRAGEGVYFRDTKKLETEEWSEGALQDRIAGSYPNFVKLHDDSQADWQANRLASRYERIKSSWRKKK